MSSISFCFVESLPIKAKAIMLLTLPTAFNVPLPPKRFLSSSRNSSASLSPVEAPEGTIALPTIPFFNVTLQATVGKPRESNTSYAYTEAILNLFLNI